MTQQRGPRRSAVCTRSTVANMYAHSYCKKYDCPCICHVKVNKDPNMYGVSPVTPITNAAPTNQSYAQLQHMHDWFNENILYGKGKGEFYFSGEGVRNAVFGEVSHKFNVRFDSPLVECLVKSKLDTTTFDNTPNGKVEFILDKPEPPIWNFDNLTFPNIIIPSFAGVINWDNITSPEDTIKYGVVMATKFNLTIEQSTITKLAKMVEQNQPVEQSNEVIVGFRNYSMSDGYLKGMHGNYWKTETLEVECPNFKQHVKEVDSDWRSRGTGNSGEGQHDCGIYLYKDPVEALYEYGPKANSGQSRAIALTVGYGVVGEFEKGYRVQKCKIIKLWVWEGSPELGPYYGNIEQVMINAKFSDFLYDGEVQQWAGRGK